MDTQDGDSDRAEASFGDRPVSPLVALLIVVAALSTPFVSFLLDNSNEVVDVPLVLRWWGSVLLGCMLLLGWALRRGRAAGAWAAVAIAFAVYALLSFPHREVRALTGRDDLASCAWLAVCVALILLAWKLGETRSFQTFVAMMSIGLLIVAAVPTSTGGSSPGVEALGSATLPRDLSLARTPDIWYFVLDGHADLQYFATETEYDPADFEVFLRVRDFAVQRDARSNHLFTYMSIASVLEMDYLYEGRDRPAPRPFLRSIRGGSETISALVGAGYSYAHAYPGIWDGSRCGGREDFCTGDQAELNSTAVALRAMTPFPGVGEAAGDRLAIAEANNPKTVVSRIMAAKLSSPSFNFVHLLTPHAPFLRTSDCAIRSVRYELGDWEDKEAYGDAAACLHRQLREAVDTIIDRDPESVIIIQGDHGHRVEQEALFDTGELIADGEWFSTLSAIHLPPVCRTPSIPDDLTLVNTFRVVFGCLLDKPVDLLPNRLVPVVAR